MDRLNLAGTRLGELLEQDTHDEDSYYGSTDYSLRQPEPLFRPIGEPTPFPVNSLGETLGAATQALIETVKAPDAICAQSILAAASLAVQGLRDIEIDGRKCPLSENFLTIALSGERKSGVDRPALRAHVEWEKNQLDKYGVLHDQYVVALEIYKRAKSQAMGKKDGANVLSITQMDAAIKAIGEPPLEPISSIILIEEPTYEGLVKLLVRNHPSVGIFTDEGGRLIGGHAMNGDNILKTLAGLSSLWDGKPISRSRGGDGTSKLFGRRLSMHLMIQPEVANLLLGNQIAHGQGFLSRCLMAWPKSNMGTRTYESADLQNNLSMQKYWATIKKLMDIPFSYALGTRNELNLFTLRLSPGAHALWIAFYNSVEAELGSEGRYRTIAGFGSKSGEHALRIAGILSVVGNPDFIEVGEEKMAAAIEIMNYYLSESLRLHGASYLDRNLVEAQALLDWLASKGLQTIYPALIYQNGPRSIRDSKRSRALISILEGHGWLKRLEPTTLDGSMRKDAWEVVKWD